jgi:hypothetical protein
VTVHENRPSDKEKNTNMSNCGMTVTGTRTRYECFLRQLKAYGLVVYNTLHKLFFIKSDLDARSSIKHKLQHMITYTTFREDIQKKCSDINHVIYCTLVPYVHLMGLENVTDSLGTDYVPALWTIFTRIIFEKPSLILADGIEGEKVHFIQESFQWFICEQIKTTHTKKTQNMM